MAIHYEWDFEYVDEHGDITDHNHCATFREVKQVEARDRGAGRIVLVRTDDQPYGEREWAYLGDNGKLPSHFSDSGDRRGARVPLRFHVEVAAVSTT